MKDFGTALVYQGSLAMLACIGGDVDMEEESLQSNRRNRRILYMNVRRKHEHHDPTVQVDHSHNRFQMEEMSSVRKPRQKPC